MAVRIGPFEVTEPIGEGSMGEVWRGRHEPSGRDVAVKFATELSGASRSQRREFREEVRAQAALSHRGIVRIYEYGRVRSDLEERSSGRFAVETPYLIMEYAAGGTLLEKPPRSDWEAIRRLLSEVLDTLAYVHAREVIHRDLKPSNMLWFPGSGERRQAKLADFGLAYIPERRLTETDRNLVSPTAGTPVFMAPEQFRGEWRTFGPWTDLYQVGAIAWEWFCGEPPFPGDRWIDVAQGHLEEDPPTFEPECVVPEGMERWLRRLLAKEPADRFRRAADASRNLEAIAGDSGDPPSSGRAERSGLSDDSQTAREARAEDYEMLVGAGRGLFGLREIPFVDRDSERRRLWEAVRDVAREERPRVVLIDGESGTGKSRLAEWVARRAHETGAAMPLRVVHTRQGSPGEGLSGLVEDTFETWGLDREEARELILERLAIWAPPGIDRSRLREDAEGLARLATEFEDDGSEVPAGDPDLRQFVVLERLVAYLGRERSTLVTLDDIQWGRTTLKCLELILERRPNLPVTFVVTARSAALEGELGDRMRQIRVLLPESRFERLHLEPLSSEDHAGMVRRLLPMTPTLVDRVTEQTAGNPLVAFQLVGDLLERRGFERTDDGFDLRGASDEDDVPEALHEVWQRRLDQAVESLPGTRHESARMALVMAAALGRRVDRREWTAACRRLGVGEHPRLVERLAERGLAELRPEGWNFTHEIIVESIARLARKQGHWEEYKRVAAETLGEVYADRPELAARRRAEYWIEGGRPREALEPLLQAVDTRVVQTANREIDDLLDRRLELIEELALPNERRLRVQNWIRRASARRRAARPERAVDLLERSVRTARTEEWPEELGRALLERAYLLGHRGDLPRSVREFERAQSHFEAEGSRLRVAECAARKVRFLAALGSYEEAWAAVGRAQDIFEGAGHELYYRMSRQIEGVLLLFQGRLSEVHELIREQQSWVNREGYRWVETLTMDALAQVLSFEGDLKRAGELLGRIRRRFRRFGHRQNFYRATVEQGWVHLARGDAAEAELVVDEIERQTAISAFGAVRVGVKLLRAGCSAARTEFGEWDESLDAFRRDGGAPLLGAFPQARRFEFLGDLAKEHDAPERAGEVYRAARRRWERLEFDDALERVDGKLAEVSTP